MVATFLGLAMVPFVVSLAMLFFLARHDVQKIRAEGLVQEARLLSELLSTRVEGIAQTAAGLASLPEVRAHLAGQGPQPRAVLSTVRRLMPGIQTVQLVPADTPEGASPVGPGAGAVIWTEDDHLVIRAPVTDLHGEWVGTLALVMGLDRLRRDVEWFRSGPAGRAVLFGDGDKVLAAPEGVPVPPLTESPEGWVTFEADGRSYVAGLAPVSVGPSRTGWFVAVVQPTADLLAPFYFVARQIGLLLLVLVVAVVALAWRMAGQFIRPILRIRDGAEIVSRINLNHRIDVHTGDELEELADAFNRMAQTLSNSYHELEARIGETTRHLQEERNRLATVLRTMREGLVVANLAGDVVLMNPRARALLDRGPGSAIGGPLTRILPADRVSFYLRRLRRKWDEGREALEEVVFPLADGPLLRGTLAVVPGPGGEFAGFLLVFREAVLSPEERRADETLRQMPELLKGPVATAGALVEALGRHPDMGEGKRGAFQEALAQELERLAERVRAAEEAAALVSGARWEMVPADPRKLLEEAVSLVPGAYVDLQQAGDGVPRVLVEPFVWVTAVATALRWLGERVSGWNPVYATIEVTDDAVVTVFRMEGVPELETRELERLEVRAEGEAPTTLGEAVRQNRGELWLRRVDGAVEICLGLERAALVMGEDAEPGILDEQPEFYDFDLFLPHPTVEGESLLSTPLSELEYVVLDTETTGLRPSQGDRIVSLSAVRIRGGKVVAGSVFHTLVNPGRPIPPESVKFHGIDDEAVKDAPSLAEVLPRFYEFVGKAVLVAHNAAFDKKFLDLGAREAGLAELDNPILDTLFLSYGVHKDFEGHNLDAIAARLGVAVEARHTSLGDARTTAAVFLKLIPLLERRGVRTLADAKAFCDRMLLLRWQSSRF